MIEHKSILEDIASGLDDWTPFGWRVTASTTVGNKKSINLARDTEMPNYQRLTELERTYNEEKRDALAAAREIAIVNEKHPKGKMITLFVIGILLSIIFSGVDEIGIILTLVGAILVISGLFMLVMRLVKGAKPTNEYKTALKKCCDALYEAEKLAS